MAENFWNDKGQISREDLSQFTEEVYKVISQLKVNSALGPDGFSYAFYRACWDIVKNDFMHMVNDFSKERLDISRLNYGAITLILNNSD